MCLWEAEVSVCQQKPHRLLLATHETGGARWGWSWAAKRQSWPKAPECQVQQSLEPICPTSSVLPLGPHQMRARKSFRLPAITLSTCCRTPLLSLPPSTACLVSQWSGTDLEAPCLSRHRIPLDRMFFLLGNQTCSPATSSYTPMLCPQDNQPDRTAP